LKFYSPSFLQNRTMADPASTDNLPPPPSDTADSSSTGYPGPPSRLPSGDDIEEGNFNDEPKK